MHPHVLDTGFLAEDRITLRSEGGVAWRRSLGWIFCAGGEPGTACAGASGMEASCATHTAIDTVSLHRGHDVVRPGIGRGATGAGGGRRILVNSSYKRLWKSCRYSSAISGKRQNLGYGRGRSSNTTSERSCTRSRTTSRPSGETSKSRMSKSVARLVSCRSVPVSKSMSQRFLC
jgi:hypothetical protein